MWPGVGIAWILVNVSPKISSQSAGWMARVYSSVRSWRILRSSTQHSVMTRLASRRAIANAVSSGRSGTVLSRGGDPPDPPAVGSAEATGGTPGAADVTDASPLGVVVERAAGVVAEHVVQRGPAAEHGLQHPGGAGGADRARVHERHPVAVGVRLVPVVGSHQHGGPGGL